MEVVIGPEIIRSYKRLSYTPWYALAEFVDNSTQSFFDYREQLTVANFGDSAPLSVDITYNRSGSGSIRVSDNAMGMSFEELSSALHIGRPRQVENTGRSEFGMGLKTAACWFGNQWTVSTSRLGESGGHQIHFDVERIASGIKDLQYQEIEADDHEHYTVVEINDLNQRMTRHEINRVKRFLESIYRVDTSDEVLALTFNGHRIVWESPIEAGNVHISDGSPCHLEFPKFEINGKEVTGWIAVLERGSREDAGFTIIRRGRVIKGYPDSWRPEEIFGQYQGSNDLVNQRLVGEIHLNDFGVSHTKSDILWQDGEQESLGLALQRISQEYVDIARSYRKRGTRRGSPSRATINAAIDLLEEEMASPTFQQIVTTNGAVPQERYEHLSVPMMRAVSSAPATKMYQFSGVAVFLYVSDQLSQTDPYMGIDVRPDGTLNIAINLNHPHFKGLSGRIGVFNHLKSCTYEGLAQWKVENTWDTQSPSAMRAIKDALLRVAQSISDQTE